MVLLSRQGEGAEEERQWLLRADVLFILLELGMIAPYVIHAQLSARSARTSLDMILGGPFTGLFLMTHVVEAYPMAIQGGVTHFLMPALPNEPELAGDTMYLQWIVYDSARRFSLGVSNGLRVQIGRPPLGSSGWTEGDANSTQIQDVVVGALVVQFQ